MEEWTTWRRVLVVKPGAGGRLEGSVNCGPQPQVPTQWPFAATALCAAQQRPVVMARCVNQMVGRKKRFFSCVSLDIC
jgi:hypothetical protein